MPDLSHLETRAVAIWWDGSWCSHWCVMQMAAWVGQGNLAFCQGEGGRQALWTLLVTKPVRKSRPLRLLIQCSDGGRCQCKKNLVAEGILWFFPVKEQLESLSRGSQREWLSQLPSQHQGGATLARHGVGCSETKRPSDAPGWLVGSLSWEIFVKISWFPARLPLGFSKKNC